MRYRSGGGKHSKEIRMLRENIVGEIRGKLRTRESQRVRGVKDRAPGVGDQRSGDCSRNLEEHKGWEGK